MIATKYVNQADGSPCTFPSLSVLNADFLVSESPRWLLENGRPVEAREVFLKIAKTNGVEPGSDFDKSFAQLKEMVKQDRDGLQQKSLVESFKNMVAVPEFRRRALVNMSVYAVQNNVIEIS